MARRRKWADPFYWRAKSGWYVYCYDNETFYKMTPARIPNNGKKSPYRPR